MKTCIQHCAITLIEIDLLHSIKEQNISNTGLDCRNALWNKEWRTYMGFRNRCVAFSNTFDTKEIILKEPRSKYDGVSFPSYIFQIFHTSSNAAFSYFPVIEWYLIKEAHAKEILLSLKKSTFCILWMIYFVFKLGLMFGVYFE